MGEGAYPSRPGSASPEKVASRFEPQALAAAMAGRRRENVQSGYSARSMARGVERVQLMFDWVAFSGETEYLQTTIAPWLKEVTLFYLSYLKLEDDGLYPMTPSDALAKLAPLPTGRWPRRAATAQESPPGRPSCIRAGSRE
ncbi:MAG: hypothetical protein KKI08_00950 [Armatimonadetes bacterium]|nr:hypothetical protein [Armatimonadota bacterium]